MASDAQGIPLYRTQSAEFPDLDHLAYWDSYGDGTPTHVAHALDAASREALWLLIVNAINEKPRWQPSDVADAVLKALGLGGDDA